MSPQRNDQVNAALDSIDTESTAAAARVQKIIDDANRTDGEGLTGPQTENVLNRLAPVVTFLKGLAADPANPIPPVPPTDPAMPGPFGPNG